MASETTPLVDVVVDRTKWGRGKSSTADLLSAKTGLMCCLGFACVAKGATPDDIIERCYPSSVCDEPGARPEVKAALASLVQAETDPKWKDDFPTKCTDAVSDLAEINDDPDIDDCERERRIAERGRDAGLNFTFIN